MKSWFRQCFKRKIKLPIWFFLIGNQVSEETPKELEKAITKIAEALLRGKSVIVQINGWPSVISRQSEAVLIRTLNSREWKLDI